MEGPQSVSKGCFIFKPKASSKTKLPDPIDLLVNQFVWYESFNQVWNNISKQLEEMEENTLSTLISELVEFISYCSSEDKIPTATLLTGVNLPDHESLFKNLSSSLKDYVSSHIAILKSSSCTSLKQIVEQTVSQFMKQNIIEDLDSDEEENVVNIKKNACTMPNLVEWYNNLSPKKTVPSPSKRSKTHNRLRNKLIIILSDFEAFSTKVLQDFFLLLSGYGKQLSLVLLLGVATSVSAVSDSLEHQVISRLELKVFQSQPSIHFLNSTIETVFLTDKCPFQIGPKIFKFLTDVFLYYDFSVNGFIQGLKFCVMEHFYKNSVAHLCKSEGDIEESVKSLTHVKLDKVCNVMSFRKYVENLPKPEMVDVLLNYDVRRKHVLNLLRGIRQKIKLFHVALKMLHCLVHDLPQAPLGKQVREMYGPAMSNTLLSSTSYKECIQLLGFLSKDELTTKLEKVLSLLQDNDNNGSWQWFDDIQSNIKGYVEELKTVGLNKVTHSPMKSPRKTNLVCSSRSQLKMRLAELKSSEIKLSPYEELRQSILAYLLQDVIASGLKPWTSEPLHEILLCEANKSNLRRKIVGAPRAALHTALNNPHHYLRCKCCEVESKDEILKEMPDLCIAYKLHLESSSLINMYDWLQSFSTIVDPDSTDDVDPKVQARFTQAVAELEFLGFIKSSKRKTDHVARLTWGGTI